MLHPSIPRLSAAFAGATALLFAVTAVGDDEQPAAPSPEASPVLRLQQADDLRRAGYYARAIEAYTALRDAESAALPAAFGLTACLLETGDYAQARQVLDDCRDAGAKSARWHLLAAEAAGCVGEYDQAIDFAERAVRLDPQLCRARLLLARTLELLGRGDEALREYEWFDRLVAVRLPIDVENLTAVGQGFYRYSVLARHPNLTQRTRHVLNKILQVAYEKVDRTYWPARVAAADLLREKYNLDEAAEDYQAALAINSSAADAHVGLGRIALEHWDFEGVERRVERALEANPHHVGAFNLLAASHLVERRYDQAVETTDRALAVNPRDVEALALQAAARFALDEPTAGAALIHQAETISPRSSLLHAIVADTFGGLRRFADAERHYEIAIANDPTAPGPRVELGLMYMEWGDEAKARDILDAAWKLDPFNERTKNTLDLLDGLEAFATIETPHFTVRFDQERDEIIGRAVADYAESIYAGVCDDYDAVLPRKTIIEIFPTHSAFGVRITGKPWIHTIGACTGWVIAMDAPRRGGDLQGPYDFAGVLRHEFTHTVTLAVTDNRIPHWFTEGLAVLQEDAPRSHAWMELLAEAVRRDQLFTLTSIDWGFRRPRRRNDRQLAYAQSEWMCEYLIERFGYEIVAGMLAAYKAGQTQEQVFATLTGDSTTAFDQHFAVWAGRQVREWGFDLRPPENVYKLRAWAVVRGKEPEVQARLARAEYDAENWDRALDAARKSVALDDRSNRLGLEVLVRTLGDFSSAANDPTERNRYDDEARPRAVRLLELDPDNRFALRALGEIHLRRRQFVEAEPLLERLARVWPADPFAARSLAGIYLERGDDEAALSRLLEVARTDEHDADIPYQIGLIYHRRGELPDARHWLTRALHIDALASEPRARLAAVLMQMNETAAAVAEYKLLCRVAPEVAEYFTACALACHKLGDAAAARTYATRAVQLDPHSPARSLLGE